jgi:hypothetical protein
MTRIRPDDSLRSLLGEAIGLPEKSGNFAQKYRHDVFREVGGWAGGRFEREDSGLAP